MRWPHGSFGCLRADHPVMARGGLAHRAGQALLQQDRRTLSPRRSLACPSGATRRAGLCKAGAAQRRLRRCVAAVKVIWRSGWGVSSSVGDTVRMNPPWPRRTALTSNSCPVSGSMITSPASRSPGRTSSSTDRDATARHSPLPSERQVGVRPTCTDNHSLCAAGRNRQRMRALVRWPVRGAGHTRPGPPSARGARGAAGARPGSRSSPGRGGLRSRSR
jgi:hypothetical protein